MILMSMCVDGGCDLRPVAGTINVKRMNLGILNLKYACCILHKYNEWMNIVLEWSRSILCKNV